jgi:hypothetical protein
MGPPLRHRDPGVHPRERTEPLAKFQLGTVRLTGMRDFAGEGFSQAAPTRCLFTLDGDGAAPNAYVDTSTLTCVAPRARHRSHMLARMLAL